MMDRLSLQIFRFGSFYLLVRGLTKEEFGIWTLFLVVCSIFEVLRQGFIQHALVRALSLNESIEHRRIINTASLFLNVIFGVLISLILFGLSKVQGYIWNAQYLSELFLIYIITSFGLIPFFHFQFIQQANLKFHGIFFSTFARHAFFFSYVLYTYFFRNTGFNLVELAWFQAIAAFIGGLVSVLMSIPFLKFSRKLDWKWVGKLITFGKFVTGTNLGMILLKFMDQIILGAFTGPAAVAGYSTSIRIGNLVEVPTQSIAAIVFPQSARSHEKQGNDAVKVLFEKSVGVILAIIIPGVLLVWLFPEHFLRFVAGERYVDQVPILRIVMLSSLFVPFSRQFSTIMDAIGKPKLNFQLTLGGAILNAILLLIFIPPFGEMGAAFSTLGAYVVMVTVSLVLLGRELMVNPLTPISFAFKLYKKGFFLIWNKLVGATG